MDLFQTSSTFKTFSSSHGLAVLTISIFCISIIFISRPLSLDTKWKLGFYLSLIPAASVIGRIIFITLEGKFTIKEELPIHLCRLLALSYPFLMYFRNIRWLNICYFFVMSATLQSVLTPDIEFDFPHYSFIFYFITHTTLIFIPLYIFFCLKIYPNLKNLISAIIYGNIYTVCTLVINKALVSNYFYTSHKPMKPSLLDFFGPWPNYLFVVEGIAIIIFFLCWLPFSKATQLERR